MCGNPDVWSRRGARPRVSSTIFWRASSGSASDVIVAAKPRPSEIMAERPQGLATGVIAAGGPLPVIILNRETITVADTLRSCTIGERRAMALGVAYVPFTACSAAFAAGAQSAGARSPHVTTGVGIGVGDPAGLEVAIGEAV